ncbi:MAG TPA: SDR family NAD(P)-dependent oxidoreductase [Burkholderiales bacterium]|jgi:UDP-glucuronate 4-epimerase|nr:SDR family NAD(P)-dependent oxidoreductase [Burkholderiales bacterium]
MKILVTGVAGFIGMHCAQRLTARGDEVVGVDNLSPYYSVQLKRDRLKQLRIEFHELDIANASDLKKVFEKAKPDAVLHLAAQAGVRYSLENPAVYIQTNLVGFANLLECCRQHPPGHLVFASSSSVYGTNPVPWSESQSVDHPVSLYAATKKSNELMAHAYSHLFGLHATALRYFTVYGPWGRPDMSPMLFANAILGEKPIQVFNHGDMQRDFTYVDDIVEGTLRVLDRPQRYAVYNIGNHQAVGLLDYIAALERALGKKALLEMKPMQPGDVKATYADTTALARAVGFAPSTPLEEGLQRFAAWFRQYYRRA